MHCGSTLSAFSSLTVRAHCVSLRAHIAKVACATDGEGQWVYVSEMSRIRIIDAFLGWTIFWDVQRRRVIGEVLV